MIAEDTRMLAVWAGALMLAGPRRTRPLAGFAYGVLLSRAHGAAMRRWQARSVETLERLFDERESVGSRVDRLEAIVRSMYGGRELDVIERGVTLPAHDRDSLVVFHGEHRAP